MEVVAKLLELYERSSRRDWLTAAAVLVGAVTVKQLLRGHRLLARVNYIPGHWYILRQNPLLGLLGLPRIPFVYSGWGWAYRDKHQRYERCNSDIITVFGLLPSPGMAIAIADATVAKEIATNRTLFTKPVHVYKPVGIYGTNVVTSENEEWKLHRRITAPSFNERNNRLVFEESMKIVSDLFAHWESKFGGGMVVKVEDVAEVTTQFALMVIAAAGFDVHYAWEEKKEESTQGHMFTLPDSLRTVMSNIIIRIAFSDRLLRLTKKGRDTEAAFRDFKTHMVHLIEERKGIPEEERRPDLLSNLLEATAQEKYSAEQSTFQFGDNELLGNIFIFLFAGHETTANTLAFAIALLAAHPEVQEKLYASIRELVPLGETLTYAAIVKWSYGLSVIYETLRLYPPLTSIPKEATEDTVVTTHSTDGKETPILVPIPKNTHIMLSIVGMHYNPKYWDEPCAFRPERFLKEYNRDAFFPFAAGPRSCMGRRFSEIEALTFLANLVLTYKFSGTKLYEKETDEEVCARIVGWQLGPITLHPTKVPLTLMKREA